MDRDTAHAGWQQLSSRIKQRWNRLSDEEISQAAGDREYLVSKVHERYGLARDEIDEELDLLGVDEPDTVVGPLGSRGYANADSVVPPGSGLGDQGEAAGYEQSRDSSLANRDVALGEDVRIGSEMDAERSHQVPDDPGSGASAKGEERQAANSVRREGGRDQQDVLKDSGSSTRSGRAAPLDRPERRQHRSQGGSGRRS